jgi:peptide/nickel transport system permease protein
MGERLRFWQRPRHRISVAVLGAFIALAFGADLVAGDLPLWVKLDGTLYLAPAVLRPVALRAHDNASLSALQGTRVTALLRPPIAMGPLQSDLHAPPLSPPSRRHLLGTDGVGRDVLARLIHGTRVSLAVGLCATMLAALIGLLLGAVAGFAGGAVDAVLARAMEVVQTFPALLLLLCVMALYPHAGLGVLIAVLGLTRWVELGRQARAEAARVRVQEYVLAARALGSPERRTFVVHVLPAAAAPVLVSASLAVGSIILVESALSFLGFGVPPPAPSWGELLGQARGSPAAWWLALPPGLCIFLVVSACNVLGEGLRHALGAAGQRLPDASS